MRSEGFQIGRIYGIPIFLHPSWFFIFGLIAVSFVSKYEALNLSIPTTQLWGLGLATSVLFFGSLVFHEMAHSVTAKHYKIPVVSITLFIFGGVARISRDPSRAIEEFNIAVAGPISSFLLAGGFGIVYCAGGCARCARGPSRGRHHDRGPAHGRPRDFTRGLRAGNSAHRSPGAPGGR